MSYELIQKKTFDLSKAAILLYKSGEGRNIQLLKQFFRASTSIGANVEEAIGAYSNRDFANKMTIAYKEARETKYWLRLFIATNSFEQSSLEKLLAETDEICRILYSIIRTVKTKL